MRSFVASILVCSLVTAMSPAAQAAFRRTTPEQRTERAAAKVLKRDAKLQKKADRKRESLGPTMLLQPRAPGSVAPRTGQAATEADVATGEQIKEAFRGRAGFAQAVLQGRMRLRDGGPDGLLLALGRIEDQLEEHPVFPVDPRGRRDQRVLRRAQDVQRDARLLLRRLSRIPGIVPAGYAPALTQLSIDELEAMLGEQDLYTRDSVDGVRDLLHDDVFAERLAARTAGRGGQEGQDVVEQLMPLSKALAEGAEVVSLDKLDLGRPKSLPLELQVATAKDPAVARALASLQARGVKVRMQSLSGTPHGVLEAINLVAVTSQENYLKTWLPQLVTQRKRPNLRPTPNGLVRARAARMVEQGEDPRERLEVATDLIDGAVGSYLRVIAEDGSDDDEDVRTVNAALEGARRKLAKRRMLFDNAHERTEGAQDVLKKMMLLGPMAHSLEMLDLGMAAKVLTSSGDDAMAEVAEWKALRGSGFTNRELMKRAKVLVPVGVAATFAAAGSHSMIEHGNAVLGGATFGASAVALSLTTALQSIRMYKHGYVELLRQGKIEGKVGVAMKQDFQKNLRQLAAAEQRLGSLFQAKNKPRLLKMVKQELAAGVAGGAMDQAEADGILSELESLDMASFGQALELPSTAHQWKEAFGQDFSNPARLGVILGAAAAPFVGAAAGAKGLLHNGFVLAGVGSTESVVAGATVFAARQLNEIKYAGGQAAELARAQGKRGFVEVSLGLGKTALETRQRKGAE